MEYETVADEIKELTEAIAENNDYHIMVYLRIVTKILGLDIKDYRRIIKKIYNSHIEFPDLDL